MAVARCFKRHFATAIFHIYFHFDERYDFQKQAFLVYCSPGSLRQHTPFLFSTSFFIYIVYYCVTQAFSTVCAHDILFWLIKKRRRNEFSLRFCHIGSFGTAAYPVILHLTVHICCCNRNQPCTLSASFLPCLIPVFGFILLYLSDRLFRTFHTHPGNCRICHPSSSPMPYSN